MTADAPDENARARREAQTSRARLSGSGVDDEALPQIAPADDGRAAPETAELDGAVEQAGTGGDEDWRRWFQQTYPPIGLVDNDFVHRLNRD